MLAIFWPRKQILDFFKSVGCSDEVLVSIQGQLPRHLIVSQCFERLSARPDRGFTIYQLMIDRLSNWDYFDPYFFDELKKLDKSKAEQAVAALKRMIKNRNQETEARRASASNTRGRQANTDDKSALFKAFKQIYGDKVGPQERGRLFEVFLKAMFDKNSISMGDPFSLTGEQIDGTFKFEGENYIVEAKWQDPTASTHQLYTFAHKVDGKMHGRGLFISVSGFSVDSIRAIVHGKHIQTILMDGEDLSHILEDRLTLEEVLDYKIRAAQTRGDVYVCALRKGNKI